jgi:hypothetical protein
MKRQQAAKAPRRFLPGRRGTIIIYSLVVLAVLGGLIGGVLRGAVAQRKLSDSFQVHSQEFAVAEYQLNKAFGELSYAMRNTGATNPGTVVASIAPVEVPGYTVDSFGINLASETNNEITAPDPWAGYTLRRQTYRIATTVRRTDQRGAYHALHQGVSLQQDLQITFIPLWIFGIFYANELELHPSPPFVETGRVHTNSNFFFGSDGNTMDFKNYVSTVGHMQYGRNPNSGKTLGNGTNSFWNGSQLVNDMQNGVRVDWTYNQNGVTWEDKAAQLWNNYVRDSAHNVSPFELPWPNVVPNIELIRPASNQDTLALLQNKFVYKAGLTITRSGGVTTAVNANGDTVNLNYTYNGQPKSVVSTGGFYNEREGGAVSTLNIDLGNMQQAGIAPTNGIVYVRNLDTNGAVRLLNSADLPGIQNTGFSLATPNPLYVQGDFNSVNKTASMLAGDSINILSSAWLDAQNDTSGERASPRDASGNTVLNAVCVGGNVPTYVEANGTKHYSGGAENFFRYMENWGSGRKHIFSGSIINLWKSEDATGNWDTQKYTPPFRQWGWDPDLAANGGPPGSPVTFAVSKLKWNIQYN